MRGPDQTTQPDAQTFKTNSLFVTRQPSDPTSEGGHDDANRQLSDGEIYGLLKSPRRRFVLWYLQDAERPLSLGDLAEQTAAWENGKDVVEVDSTERKRAYVALYQCHLPKLDEVDVIEFDQDRKRVDVGPNYDRLVRAALSMTDSTADTDSFAPYYLLLAAASLLLVISSIVLVRSQDVALTAVVLAVIASFGVLATWDFLRSTDDPWSVVRAKLDRLR